MKAGTALEVQEPSQMDCSSQNQWAVPGSAVGRTELVAVAAGVVVVVVVVVVVASKHPGLPVAELVAGPVAGPAVGPAVGPIVALVVAPTIPAVAASTQPASPLVVPAAGTG